MEKKLHRDDNNKMIGGVAAGLSDYFDIDVTWIRVAFIVGIFAGFGMLAYIILWIIVPAKPYMPGMATDYKVFNENVNNPIAEQYKAAQKSKKDKSRLTAGIIMVLIGMYFMFNQLDLIPYWFSFRKLWPLALIIPGIFMLLKSRKTQSWDTNTVADQPTSTGTNQTFN